MLLLEQRLSATEREAAVLTRGEQRVDNLAGVARPTPSCVENPEVPVCRSPLIRPALTDLNAIGVFLIRQAALQNFLPGATSN
jgi:hypothetical protein